MDDRNVNDGKDVILSSVNMDMGYNQGKLMFIAGKEDATVGDVGTLDRPVQAQGVTIDPLESDVVLFSYVLTKGGQGSLRELTGKLDSFAGDPARFSVLVPSADGNWVTRTADVTLVDSAGAVVSINPHGLAQYGNYLYLPDYQNGKISIVNAGDLEAAADGTAVEVRTFDMGAAWDPTPPIYAARGQAAVVLGNYLYVLGIDTDGGAQRFGSSRLFRLAINGVTGDLTLDAQIPMGANAQSIIPVTDRRTVQLLVPIIGGRQDYDGETNGTDSNISYVAAEGRWPSTASAKVTGDPTATPATAYDIHAVAAAMRDGSSFIYILTQLYDNGSETALWRIYRTTVSDFLRIADGTALSDAVTADDLTVVDQGTVTAGSDMISYGIYMWDLLYEQVPGNDDEGDRVWAALGTPILATRAGDNEIMDPGYGSPTGIYQNAYIQYGYLGGVNLNAGAFDLTIETQNQTARGVSLKRNFRKAQTPKPTDEEIKAAQAKAAEAVAAKNK